MTKTRRAGFRKKRRRGGRRRTRRRRSRGGKHRKTKVCAIREMVPGKCGNPLQPRLTRKGGRRKRKHKRR